ncbi:MAG: rhomboid family intramembrane serine protease [Solobacterium sp.]|nr:rhomboid family intramembrane serine protease [Solobacterium sp.]
MKKITWNSPVVLSFALLSAASLAAGWLTGGRSTAYLFTVYRGSLADPLFYLRLLTHVLGHASLEHYANNMLLFLLVGPLLEEKYGSRNLLEIIVIVAVITGLVHILISPATGLLGASGVVFAFILLASVTGTKNSNSIPLTLLIAALIYITQQIFHGVVLRDNVSQLTHIIGGAIGAVYGMAVNPHRK